MFTNVDNMVGLMRKMHLDYSVIYGFKIDKNDSNPATRVHYIAANENYDSAYMDYANNTFNYGDQADAFFMPRPCMVKTDGTVDYFLDPNDYTKKLDGTASDVANTAYDGNAFMQQPLMFIKTYEDENYEYCYISDGKVDDAYNCYSFYDRAGNIIPYCYTAIYNGSLIDGKLRSLSGQSCMHSQTAYNEASYARANGKDYYIDLNCDNQMIRLLTILIGKTTDSQTVFGNGHYTGGSGAGSLLATGTMNDKGLFQGTNGTGSGVKIFGIENYYGNQWRRLAGYINNRGLTMVKMTYTTADGSAVDDYNFDGSGYIVISDCTPGGTSGGYISSMKMSSKGLYPHVASGSDSTYYTDGFQFNNGQNNYAIVGGSCDVGLRVGVLCSSVNDLPSYASWYIGAALSLKPILP